MARFGRDIWSVLGGVGEPGGVGRVWRWGTGSRKCELECGDRWGGSHQGSSRFWPGAEALWGPSGSPWCPPPMSSGAPWMGVRVLIGK